MSVEKMTLFFRIHMYIWIVPMENAKCQNERHDQRNLPNVIMENVERQMHQRNMNILTMGKKYIQKKSFKNIIDAKLERFNYKLKHLFKQKLISNCTRKGA